jgi:hypothetical protein
MSESCGGYTGRAYGDYKCATCESVAPSCTDVSFAP